MKQDQSNSNVDFYDVTDKNKDNIESKENIENSRASPTNKKILKDEEKTTVSKMNLIPASFNENDEKKSVSTKNNAIQEEGKQYYDNEESKIPNKNEAAFSRDTKFIKRTQKLNGELSPLKFRKNPVDLFENKLFNLEDNKLDDISHEHNEGTNVKITDNEVAMYSKLIITV